MGAGGDYRCIRCKAAFVPFRRGLPCPSCGVPADSEVPVLGAILRTYEDNVRAHGSGVPPTIAVASLWDDYLYRGLFFLKAIDGRRPRESEESVLRRTLNATNATKGAGWRNHLEDFYRALLRARRTAADRPRGPSETEK